MPSFEKDYPFRTIRITGSPSDEKEGHRAFETVAYLGRDKADPVHYIELPWAIVRLLRNMEHAP